MLEVVRLRGKPFSVQRSRLKGIWERHAVKSPAPDAPAQSTPITAVVPSGEAVIASRSRLNTDVNGVCQAG